jgi:hypothetical protein
MTKKYDTVRNSDKLKREPLFYKDLRHNLSNMR